MPLEQGSQFTTTASAGTRPSGSPVVETGALTVSEQPMTEEQLRVHTAAIALAAAKVALDDYNASLAEQNVRSGTNYHVPGFWEDGITRS